MADRPLQAWELGELSLPKLISAARRATPGDLKPIRIAVLGDAATQHYCLALKSVLRLRGWDAVLYEAEYDTIRQEVLDPQSGLYAHNPDIVILFPVVQSLWHRYCGSAEKPGFAETVSAEWEELRAALRSRSTAMVIQHNLVIPLDRPYGNATAGFPETFTSVVLKLNADLASAVSRGDAVVVDTEFQAGYHGKRHWLDERLWCQAKQGLSPSYLPHLAKTVSDVILIHHGVMVKCVIVDLDNTIWGGILSDDGAHLLEMGQTELGLAYLRFQLGLKLLKTRGVLLAICSKNHQADVLDVIENHPDMVLRREDFAAIVANFGDKVSNIMAICDHLNIGYDSMVFLDDTAFERDIVRSALPQIQVPDLSEDPADFLSDIARWGLMEGLPPTAEDLVRSGYYRDNAARAEIKNKFQGLDEYIADLRMVADVLPLSSYTLPRASQLVMRSNQFNLTTIRYSDLELEAMASDPAVSAFCIRLSDRLGDNGIISFVALRKNDRVAAIDTWIMSCRVLGRRVEELTIQLIVERARLMGCDFLSGRYAPTAKNAMVAGLFEQHGFAPDGYDGDARLFTLPLSEYRERAFPITINQSGA